MADKKPLVLYSGKPKEIAITDTISIVNGGSRASMVVTQASHGFSVGNAIYYTGTAYAKAKADSANTLGLCIVESVSDVNTFTLVLNGRITGLSGLTAGQYYYVSAATAGLLTVTEPATGYFSNPLLFADSTTTGFVVQFRPSVSQNPPGATGWNDILPVQFKDDASAGWTHAQIGTTGRYAWSAIGTGASSTIHLYYHIPHEVVSNPATGYWHPHIETPNNDAGNIVLTANFYAAKRDGSWTTIQTVTYTLTPSTLSSSGKNMVIDLSLPTAILAELEPDALVYCRLVRDPALAGDTYTSSVFLFTGDCHVTFHKHGTTEKDKGSGWVQSS